MHIGSIPDIANLIGGEGASAASGRSFAKLRPEDGTRLCQVARSGAEDVGAAVAAAVAAQPAWASETPVERGRIVRELALALQARREEAAELVVEDTGKSLELALGEADAAVEMGFFVAGEGRRLYGRTTTSAMPSRTVMTLRRPVGVAALIVSFNTPLPNYAWKVFPAVFCGNAAVLKPSEYTPASAAFFGELCREFLPPGVLNVVQGLGSEAGPPLVESQDVDLVSFTVPRRRGAGSTSAPEVGSRRSVSSSAARTRSSSATTPISTRRSSGRSRRRSRTGGSGARRRAGSSCSTASTRSFEIGWSKVRAATTPDP